MGERERERDRERMPVLIGFLLSFSLFYSTQAPAYGKMLSTFRENLSP
jgi:hypothetical protein